MLPAGSSAPWPSSQGDDGRGSRGAAVGSYQRQRLHGAVGPGLKLHHNSTVGGSEHTAGRGKSRGDGSGSSSSSNSHSRSVCVWSAAQQAIMQRIGTALMRLHARGAREKTAAEFLHVSKSGGTSMCSLSVVNGCKVHGTSKYVNCMLIFLDDTPRWASATVHNRTAPEPKTRFFLRYGEHRKDTMCKDREHALRKRSLTFYSNEFTLHGHIRDGPEGAHACPQFLNVALLREPHVRLQSHMRWITKVCMWLRHCSDGYECNQLVCISSA